MQLPRNPDFNGPEQAGVGHYQVTQINGERCSAAKAYLTPVLGRPNLAVVTGAQAKRILFEGRRAVGVTYRRAGGDHEVRAGRQVILAGGAFNSPHLLALSGVGPGAELRRHGIDVVHDLAGVGANLQDHVDYVTIHKTRSRHAFGLSAGGAIDLIRAIAEWRRTRTGRLTSNFAEAGGFLKSRPDLAKPDLQFHFVIGIVDDHNRKLHPGHGYSCHVCLLRPKSRGRVGLKSARPLDPPLIDPNFFAAPEDLDAMVSGFKLTRRILAGRALAPYRGRELHTAGVTDDDAIRDWIVKRADTVYHPVGTCKMGTDDRAVVDPELQVRGLDGLRVVDGSVMPTIVGGNTNAPIIMIAEKAADMIQAAA